MDAFEVEVEFCGFFFFSIKNLLDPNAMFGLFFSSFLAGIPFS